MTWTVNIYSYWPIDDERRLVTTKHFRWRWTARLFKTIHETFGIAGWPIITFGEIEREEQ